MESGLAKQPAQRTGASRFRREQIEHHRQPVHMKTVVTPLIALLLIGAVVAFGVRASNGHGDFGILEWCLVVFALLFAVWIIAILLNVAIFAPVYRVLGRLQSKTGKAREKHERDG